MTSGTPIRIKDRQLTRKRLISAVGSLLAKKGFKAVGVNAVAREAGVDKVLIYRYFGGLPGLIKAYGVEGDFWPDVLELAGGDLKLFSRASLQEKLAIMARQFIRALKKRPVTCEIMIWEMIKRNELTAELESVRENSIVEFYRLFLATGETREDLQAIVALIGAAVSYLVLRSRQIDVYGGLDLSSDDGWDRLEQSIDAIIQGVLSPATA